MEEEAEKEEGDQQWEEEKERKAKEDAERTEKKRRDRERKKKRGKGKDNTAKQHVNGGGQDAANGNTTASTTGMAKKPLQIPRRDDTGSEDDDVGAPAVGNGAQTNGHEENGITIHDDD